MKSVRISGERNTEKMLEALHDDMLLEHAGIHAFIK